MLPMTKQDRLPDALRDALADRGVSYRVFADMLAELGLDRSKDTVNLWVNGVQPMRPDEVFLVERALELKPGELSRVAGFLPADAKPAVSIEDAIRADLRLRPASKRFLLAALKGVLAEDRKSR